MTDAIVRYVVAVVLLAVGFVPLASLLALLFTAGADGRRTRRR